MKRQVATRRLLALQYFAHIPPRSAHFRWPDSRNLLEIQDDVCRDLFNEEEMVSSEQSSSYKRSFLKELIARLERAVAESNDIDLVSRDQSISTERDLTSSLYVRKLTRTSWYALHE